jgi:ferredoxin
MMNENVYRRLAGVLDTLPNGFPATGNGVELRLLEKIFTPEEAELFCDLRMSFETAEDISRRTGRPLEGLEEMLKGMAERGQLFALDLGGVSFFKMMPWAFGIYEFQAHRIDREFAELNEEYGPVYARQFFDKSPQLMQTLPVEREISVSQEALPYERISAIIEHAQSFRVADCICKKERGLLGEHCDRPVEVCLAIAPVPGVFENSPHGRVLTREQAYELIRKTEEAGLVHLTSNLQHGHIYICNCCKCCCGVLRSINNLGIPAGLVVNSHHYAVIDEEMCTNCGICAQERCQVNAIEEGPDGFRVVRERCIGCGLCIATCPTVAIRLVRKEQNEIAVPPLTEDEWFQQRADRRGVDYGRFK